MPSSTILSERPRILVVDDNQAMLDRSAAVLARDYIVVGLANDGPTAVTSALELQPDVVVLDISMPVMNGLEVVSRLRAAGCSARIVFLTIHDEEDIVAAAQATGALGYVIKPRLAADLIPAVRAALVGQSFTSRRR
jgi:DNA-binding NarL/FixJ family response regulator